MFFDLDAVAQGEYFQFFTSRINPESGDVIYDPPAGDARAKIRSFRPFHEERMSKRKIQHETVYNNKTRSMERISFYPALSPEEVKAQRDDAYDYAIMDFENFKDSKTGELIACTRENKLKLMALPVFDRFVARCQELLDASGVKDAEEAEKN